VRQRTRGAIGEAEFVDRYNSLEAVWLFCTNAEKEQHNLAMLAQLESPCVRFDAVDSPGLGDSRDLSLQKNLHLKVGASVVLTRNIDLYARLANGTRGTVTGFEFDADHMPPSQPRSVIGEFPDYTGPPQFRGEGREKWVAVAPCDERLEHDRSKARTQVPLALGYGWTVWKSQGQTITGPLCIQLPDTEREPGLVYTAFSRAREWSQVALAGGVSVERLKKIGTSKANKLRIEYEKTLDAKQDALREWWDNLPPESKEFQGVDPV